MPLITRESYSVERSPVMPDWLKDFAATLDKKAVEPMRKHEPSLHDQISSIMGGTKSRYASVEAAVEDYKTRTGLAQYNNKVTAKPNGATTKKKAQAFDAEKAKKYCDGCKSENCKCPDDCSCSVHCLLKKKSGTNDIKIFDQVPQIKKTIDNYIEDTKGNTVLPAIVQRVKSIHAGDVTDDSVWNDETFLRYINDKNIAEKKKYPNTDEAQYSNLGKVQQYSDTDIDPSNDDALHSLMPATFK